MSDLKNSTFFQQGRSMAEMLGVLAIAGILSLVGVKAYTYAMNKHRANELINEASKRAVVIASQIMAGRDGNSLSLAEFSNPDGYTFSVEQNPLNPKQFNVLIDAVDTDICAQMHMLLGNSTLIRTISEHCDKLTFNNDLSTVVSQEECLKANKIWCTHTGLCSDDGKCCFGGNCASESCPSGASTNGTKAGGKTGIFVDGTECVCDEETEVYNGGGSCISRPTTCTSWTENECGKGYYCSFAYSADNNLNSSLDETPNTDEQQCYHDLTGTCTTLSAGAPTAARMKILTEAGFKSTFIMGGKMNWWSGASWCLAQGKKLIDVADIECYADGQTLIRSGSGKSLCCKQGEQCEDVWESSWNRDQVISGKEADVAKFSKKMQALRKAYGTNNAALTFWTGSGSLANGSENSCYAFRIGANYGTASNPLRSSGYYVVCQ